MSCVARKLIGKLESASAFVCGENWTKIRMPYDDGLSITMIAVRFGVSRELIWKGLKNHKGEKIADQRQCHHDKDIDKLRK
jgi:DNA invertase Pin-like site-specific DNA recombinase